jgi:hypothetical protein
MFGLLDTVEYLNQCTWFQTFIVLVISRTRIWIRPVRSDVIGGVVCAPLRHNYRGCLSC